MKKIGIIAVLICFIATGVFSAGYPVIDVSVLFETLLQKMQEAEHFVKQIEQWKNVLEHYKREYEQIKRYYEELKGIAEKFKDDPSFKSIWENSNAFLLKLADFTSVTNSVTKELTDSLLNIKKIHGGIIDYLNSLEDGTSDYDKMIYYVENMYGGVSFYYEDFLTKNVRDSAKAENSKLKKIGETVSYYRRLLEIYKEKAEGITFKIADSEAGENILRALIAPYRENKANLGKLIEAAGSALETWEQKNVEMVKSGEMTEAQRAESLLMSTSLKNVIDDMEKKYKKNVEITASYDAAIVNIRETISRLKLLKENAEADAAYCEENIKELENKM